jgi:diguanylate cyclase (GGDEF)-like protein
MLDIDHFKAINDELGHLTGDEALVHLAGKLRRVVRAGDQVFRFGGEEFLLLLAKCDRASALRVFYRLRESLRAGPLPLEGGGTRLLSVSGGIASAEEDNGFRLGNLVGRADEALYAAKRGGRDRVEVEARAKE